MKKWQKIVSLVVVITSVMFCFWGCGKKNDNNLSEPIIDQTEEPTNDNTIKYKDFTSADFGTLPVVRVNTEGEVFPSSKEDYVNCSFLIENANEYNFEVTMKSNPKDGDAVGIRRRGNSTFYLPKKPFRVKFNKKKSLLGLTKAKSWVLLADYIDQSCIKNYTAFSLANYFDSIGFTPTPNHVIFFLNDEYMGLYLLTEQIDGSAGRTDVKVDEINVNENIDYPFLVEMGADVLNDSGVDKKDVFDFKMSGLSPFEIKYPEFAERNATEESDVVYDYIKGYFQAVVATISNHEEKVVFNGKEVGFSDLVDENSFLDYYFINEIMLNMDNSWKSIYFFKPQNGKLKFGPIWDFDWSMNDEWIEAPTDKSYIHLASQLRLVKINWFYSQYVKDEFNYAKLQARWNAVYPKLINNETGINSVLRNYKTKISNQAKKDAIYWYGETGAYQFDTQFDYVRLFLLDRFEYLNKVYNLDYSGFSNLLV